ncbi:ITGAX isoform 3 [Pan troglodytes]|uniref:ITGAX isoform 3 n=1 Tax=Pan troglodytes TaxID=9598 RepID=A0A2J8J567_PANTR|nr:ITGAX isoform 3 [Pan troglodytes]
MTRTRAALLLFTALATSLGFNLDTEELTAFRVDSAGFGDSVVQYANSWVVVGAPQKITAANQTGGLYQCVYSTGACEPISLQVPPEAVNMSLGLSLASTTSPSQLLLTQRLPVSRQGECRDHQGFEELTHIQLGVRWARDSLARVDQKEGIWKKSYHVLQWFLTLLPAHPAGRPHAAGPFL